MMRRVGIAIMLLLASAVAGRPARAQSARSGARAGTCPRVDTSATWYRRQREWMGAGAAFSDSTMRAALLALPAFSNAATSGALLGFEFVDDRATPVTSSDSAMIARLVALGGQRGSVWPTRSVVGSEGVLAVWSLAGHDTTLARIALKRMMEAGPDESPPSAVALLEDRMRVRAGRKQLYGTQLRVTAAATPAGRADVQPLPIEDTLHLAIRRDGAELPPLAQSLCAARSASAKSAAARASTDH